MATYNIFKSSVHEQFPDDNENLEMYREHCEINDIPFDEDADHDDEIREFLNETISLYFDDLRSEINHYEKQQGEGMYVLSIDAGLWYGRRDRYDLKFGLYQALTAQEGDLDIYVKDGQLKVVASHHDGINYVHIRKLTPMGERYYDNNIDDVKKTDREVLEHIFNSNRLSKEVRAFHEMYGWEN